jgi:hypothetical protein
MSKSTTGGPKSYEQRREEKKSVRRSLISETTRNIDSIANYINEGYFADKELMIKLINRMLAFLNEFVKPKEEIENAGNAPKDSV